MSTNKWIGKEDGIYSHSLYKNGIILSFIKERDVAISTT
jgi:hypothetical protein